jgi:hypothetical protein
MDPSGSAALHLSVSWIPPARTRDALARMMHAVSIDTRKSALIGLFADERAKAITRLCELYTYRERFRKSSFGHSQPRRCRAPQRPARGGGRAPRPSRSASRLGEELDRREGHNRRKEGEVVAADGAGQSTLNLHGVGASPEPYRIGDGTCPCGDNRNPTECERGEADREGARADEELGEGTTRHYQHHEPNEVAHRARIRRDAPVVRCDGRRAPARPAVRRQPSS